MKKLLILSLFMMSCGSDTVNVYNKANGDINEKPDGAFTIALAIDSDAQSVSCNIDKDCNNKIADLVNIDISMTEIRMNFETNNPGETSVKVSCTSTDANSMESTTTHEYSIIIAD